MGKEAASYYKTLLCLSFAGLSKAERKKLKRNHLLIFLAIQGILDNEQHFGRDA